MRKLNLILAALVLLTAGQAQKTTIDLPHSSLRVYVSRAGALSVLGHDHVVDAPLAEGEVTLGAAPAVSWRVHAADMKVIDPGSSDSDRNQVETNMKSAQALDVAQFPEITFASTSVELKGEGSWLVHGKLTLHGVTRQVDFPIMLRDNHYSGSIPLLQSAFGIKPVTAAGGAIKTKDQLRITFDIVLDVPSGQ